MLKFSLVLLLALMAGYAYAQDDLDTQTYTPPPTPYTCPSFTVSAIANFGSPTGLFGNSKVYAATDGTQVTAYGYLYPSTPKPLYGKNAGVGETGLGMNDDAGNDHEIDKSHYVQLDITKIRQTMAVGTQITIQIGSAQSGEGFQIYGSSAQGTRGNLITSGVGPGTNSVVTVSFAPTTNFIAVVATGSSYDANVLIVSISFCRAPAFVVGDPQFIGLRGQSYQVHGVSGEVYNIVSDVDFQYNSRFVFLDQGECPVIDGKKQKGCFSHPGSFLGEIGIKTRAGDKIHLVSGGAQQGFQLVEFNGKTVEIGETNVLAGDLGSFAYNSTHITAIKVGKWEFTFENSDMFVNQKVMVTNFKNLRSHGLLGQTWKDAKYPNALKVIAGDVDDYVIRRSDIFGDDFVFNVFN